MPDIRFAPRTHTFSVVRLDPVAMVQHLGDQEALRAAEASSPQSYVVFVDLDSALPFPGKPWYGFTVYLVGPCLRPPEEDSCVTPEMCIPIFPNFDHPEGRDPIRTQSVFPFDNCYIWSGLSMKIRVCARPDGFDWDRTIILRGHEYYRWGRYESEDMGRRIQAQRARAPPPLPLPGSHSGLLPIHSQADSATLSPHFHAMGPLSESQPPTSADVAPTSMPSPAHAGSHANTNSIYSDSSRLSTDSDGCESVDTMMEMGLFSDPTENVELQPLFHLWGDLAANIKQDEIPSPVHLLEECAAISHIIQDARARDPTLPPLPMPNFFGSAAPEPEEEGNIISANVASLAHRKKPKRFRPLKVLHKVRLRIQGLFRLPYIPIWP
ncbi:hypothetical protein L226DRAFT_615494 [Lentinus tigrinus ALCF2SS1-7]|uniref:Uncharacterized protein n=1 Tax=Lentinus tigrinus ALCF2SS1-6 TaxID=1328759 RepID=A0A5C2RZ86_9APHY|nr:hypothetical protein L227DRAFT_531893 [Lentinus tigrinus ALCF2SS1-6]RPD71484.1 hypothetical protein L226DRAFT_615494 [Lentinus tigrinus ALCF2SS1-7]